MIQLSDNRETALRVGYEATDWVRKPAYSDYEDILGDWSVRLMEADGEPIGAVYTHGPEFHVSVVPGWRGRWATRGTLKEIIPEPDAMTRVTPGFDHVGGYLERLGFEHRGSGIFVRLNHGH